MGIKRKSSQSGSQPSVKKFFRGKKKKTTYKTQMAVAKRAVQQVIAKNIETKQSVNKVDTKNILHNRINIIDSSMFNTTPGTGDPMTSDVLNRVGDEVNLRGLSLRFLVEQQVYLADVSYRFMIIKSAKGDTPTDATLFSGLSLAKIIDQINIERYTVVYSKTFSLHSRNQTTGNPQSATLLQTQGAQVLLQELNI